MSGMRQGLQIALRVTVAVSFSGVAIQRKMRLMYVVVG